MKDTKDYVKQLEQRILDIEDVVVQAAGWVPRWTEDAYGGWNYGNDHQQFGHIRHVGGKVWHLAFSMRTETEVFYKLEDAKNYLERVIGDMKP
jgi:hypothetical protein